MKLIKTTFLSLSLICASAFTCSAASLPLLNEEVVTKILLECLNDAKTKHKVLPLVKMLIESDQAHLQLEINIRGELWNQTPSERIDSLKQIQILRSLRESIRAAIRNIEDSTFDCSTKRGRAQFFEAIAQVSISGVKLSLNSLQKEVDKKLKDEL